MSASGVYTGLLSNKTYIKINLKSALSSINVKGYAKGTKNKTKQKTNAAFL